MAKKKTSRRQTRIAWSASELKKLRALAGTKPLLEIAGVLNRSKAAVQVKASSQSLSLRVQRKARKVRKVR